MACRAAPVYDYQPETSEEQQMFEKLLERGKKDEPLYLYDQVVRTPDRDMEETIMMIFKNIYDDTAFCYSDDLAHLKEPPTPAMANLSKSEEGEIAHQSAAQLLDHYHSGKEEQKIKEELLSVDKPVINLKLLTENEQIQQNAPSKAIARDNSAGEMNMSHNMSDYDHSSKTEKKNRKKEDKKKNKAKASRQSGKLAPSAAESVTKNPEPDMEPEVELKEPEHDTNQSSSTKQADDDVVVPRRRHRVHPIQAMSSNVIMHTGDAICLPSETVIKVNEENYIPAVEVNEIELSTDLRGQEPSIEQDDTKEKLGEAAPTSEQTEPIQQEQTSAEKEGNQLLLSQSLEQAMRILGSNEDDTQRVGEVPPTNDATVALEDKRGKIDDEKEAETGAKLDVQAELAKLQTQFSKEELEEQRMILEMRNTTTFNEKKERLTERVSKRKRFSIGALSNSKLKIQKVGPMLVGSVDNDVLFSIPLQIERFRFDGDTKTIYFGTSYKSSFDQVQYEKNKRIIEEECERVKEDDQIKAQQKQIIYHDELNSLLVVEDNGKCDSVLSLGDSKQKELTDGLVMIRELTGESIAILKSSQ